MTPTPIIPSAAVEVLPAGPVDAALAAPASKSVTNRLLVIAALAEGHSLLRSPLVSDDSRVMAEAVSALGVSVVIDRDVWHVQGTGGRLVAPVRPIDARLSGTTMRFVTAAAPLADGQTMVTGLPPLRRRPIGPLVVALRSLGAEVSDTGGFPPVRVSGGGLAGGSATVDVTTSSQFASALLLAAPCAQREVVVHISGTGADGYVALTAAVMRAWGARVDRDRDAWHVGAPGGYRSQDVTVEYDASAAAHLFALAVATGGRITVTNASPDTAQPDAALPAVLARMGGEVTRAGTDVTVTGPDRPAPVDVDLARMPDQVTTLAVLAALADGESVLRNVAVARGHETDRLRALATELRKLGAGVAELPDGLRIRGGALHGGVRLRTYDDHRLAMAFAAAGARVSGVGIEDPGCVSKTYPGFWEDLRTMGVGWREVTR